MSGNIAVHVFLLCGMVSIAFSVVGLMVARNVYERLHYLSPSASVGVVAIAAAVVVQESLSQAGINALLTALVIFFARLSQRRL